MKSSQKQSKILATFYQLARLFWEFFIFSFLGRIIETLFIYLTMGVREPRGCISQGLPIIPLYGFGGLLLTYGLSWCKKKPFLYFFISATALTFLELLASYFEEYILGVRTRDYSNRPLNFQGRISLSGALMWGILACFVEYYLYPRITKLIDKVGKKILMWSALLVGIYVIIINLFTYFI